MIKKTIFAFFALLFCVGTYVNADTISLPDRICGRWKSTDKDLIVDVYKSGNSFKAKIVWFETDKGSLPMDEWRDTHNPDKALRSRKILGMNVLENLEYKPESNSWEGGMIYDAEHGRDWNAAAHINKQGELKVKGYWHFKFIGRTMTFTRD